MGSGLRLGRYRETVARPTEIPSFASSARTFRAHQSFSFANRRMRVCTSTGMGGRPGPRFEMDRQYSRRPLRCQRTTVSGWTMTRVSFQPDQIRESRTQKVRSASVIRGFGPFRVKAASCWRRASSTRACSFRLRKKPGTQRRKIVVSLSSYHITRCILHEITARHETESSSGFGLPFVVDRSSAERKSSMTTGRTGFENPQGCDGVQ